MRCAWRSLFVIALASCVIFLTGSVNTCAQGTNRFEKWDQDPNWNSLTNHLQACYNTLEARYKVIGIYTSVVITRGGVTITTNEPPRPTFSFPMYDYMRFAKCIEQICPYFVMSQTNGVQITSFDWYFSKPGTNRYGEVLFPSTFPVWSASNLLFEVGITNWSTNIECWAVCDKKLVGQVQNAINLLRWTQKPADYYSTAHCCASFLPMATWNWTYQHLWEYVNEMVMETSNTNVWSFVAGSEPWNIEVTSIIDGPLWYWPWDAYKGIGVAGWSAQGWDRRAAVKGGWMSSGISTNHLRSADLYVTTSGNYQFYSIPTNGSFVLVQEFGVSSDTTHKSYEYWRNPMPAVSVPPEGRVDYRQTAGPGCFLCKWQFPAVPAFIMNQTVEELADTDADGIVDVGADIESLGPDTGTIVFRPEIDKPEVLIPMVRTPLWAVSVPVHVYLSQGAFSGLPYNYNVRKALQYESRNPEDCDGTYQALSINTHILETACVTNGPERYKKVVLQRPRGNIVVFEFAWDSAVADFCATGYPTGINASRTYVLRDTTPSDHTDWIYELHFASGIIHTYGSGEAWWWWNMRPWLGALFDVRHSDGRVGAANWMLEIPGCSWMEYYLHDFYPKYRIDTKYACSNIWANGFLQYTTYTSLDGASKIVSTPVYDERGRITALNKTGPAGVEKSDAVISANGTTINYSWGSVSKSQSAPAGMARSVRLTETPTGMDPVVYEYEYNEDDRLVCARVAANGDSLETRFGFSQDDGRYANGLLKNSQIVRVTGPNSSVVDLGYDQTNGWLISAMTPINQSVSRLTRYSYSTQDANGDQANPANIVERPRSVEQFVNDALVGHELYSYSGTTQTIVQVLGGSDATGNLIYTNRTLYWNCYSDDGSCSIAYMPEQVMTPVMRSTYSYRYDSKFLEITESGSDGQTRKKVVSGFGSTMGSMLRQDGIVVDSSSSTQDSLGHILRTDFIDGSFTSNSEYCLYGPGKVRERDGSETLYEYDDLGRVKLVNRPALARSTAYEYDSLGNAIRITETGLGKSRITTQAYDTQSRLISRTTPFGTTTISYETTSSGTRRTTTNPDTSVLIEDFNFDGSLAEVHGSAAVAHLKYNYGVDDGGFYTEEVKVGYSGTTRTYQNMLGKLNKTVFPTFRGGVASVQSLYDSAGRYSGFIDPTGIKGLTHYNSKNLVSDSGLHVNGTPEQLTPASSDRFQTYTRTVTPAGIANSTLAYPDSGDSENVELSSSKTSLDGKSGASSFANRTNSWARGSYGMVGADGGCYYETNTYADGSQTVAKYMKWQFVGLRKYDRNSVLLEMERYEYNGFGELDWIYSSIHGTTRYIHDPDTGLLKEVIPSDVSKGVTRYTYYDHTSRIKSIARPDNSIISYQYYPNGLLQQESGTGGYTVTYTYDEQGQKETMTTWRDGAAVVTHWDYDAVTGLLKRKLVDNVVVEQYDYLDNNQLASVTDADGVTATCRYDPATGDLNGTRASDGSSMVSSSIDRMGRVTGSTVLNGIGESLAYALDGSILTNTIAGNGIVSNALVKMAYDANSGDRVSFNCSRGSSANYSFKAVYTGSARVASITSGALKVSYTYTGAAFVDSVTYNYGGSNVLVKNVVWDLPNSRIMDISYVAGTKPIAGYSYQYPTNSDRVAGISEQDGAKWEYQYDSKGQLTSAAKYNSDDTEVPGMQFGYEYDEIGNTTKAGVLGVGGYPLHSFGANNFNFHTNRMWGSRVPVRGLATNGIRVAIAGTHVQQVGDRFNALVPVNNLGGSVQTNITVWAARTNVSPVSVSAVSGTLYVAKSKELVEWKQSGVLASDSRFSYRWNRFGQLLSVSSTNAAPNFRLAFDYYPDGRRARKRVYNVLNGQETLVRTHQFYYDSWNLVAEDVSDQSVVPSLNYSLTYVWGLDLAGQRSGELGQAAGGIGGLLAITLSSNGTEKVYLPVADNNGNIRKLVDAESRRVVEEYDYDPFGVLVGLRSLSSQLTICPFRFQSKYYDEEPCLYYFGYRYYDPAATKWLSRDPKGESGGVNLTAFCGNDPVNQIDPFGLAGYFFGGTGNSLDKGQMSNVEILYRAWNESAHGYAHYVPGVFSGRNAKGEKYAFWNVRLLKKLMQGAWGESLGERAEYMIDRLEEELGNGDKEVNVFGFSRGATTALVFLNMIQERRNDPRHKDLYKDIKINFVALWDTVKYTASDYRAELPEGMTLEHQPLHFIALDEQRGQFYNEQVLDFGDRSLQIGYRGVHADVGGFIYPCQENPFGWIPRNDAVGAAWLIGINFDQKTLAKYPAYSNWRATPTPNDTFFYNGGELRKFPANMYVSPSIHEFGRYTTPYNEVEFSRRQIMTRDWYRWAGKTY